MPAPLPRRLSRRRPGRINPSLGETRLAMEKLGRPQDRYPSILVLGTNGKGSTAAMLEAVLAAHGLNVGLYTSPHLVRVEERIRIGGRAVEATTLETALAALDPFPGLSFFESLTVAALALFAGARVDLAVLEAGMGGRWDATTLAEPVVAGLTNVGTDHARWLGRSREAVAAEKGAGLAAAATAVLGPGVDPVLEPALGIPRFTRAGELVDLRPEGKGVRARWPGGSARLVPPLPGEHQWENLHLALALAVAASREGILPTLDPPAVARGLAATRWSGRLSTITVRGRTILLDGAHNLEAASALARHLETFRDPPDLLFSCLEDKPAGAMLEALRPVVRHIVLVELDDPRAMPMARLCAAAPGALTAPSLAEAVDLLREPAVAAGSLRLVGALMEYAEEEAR